VARPVATVAENAAGSALVTRDSSVSSEARRRDRVIEPQPPQRWLTPEELVAIGFARSRVVMMNEAHSGLARCPRTRRVGKSVLPAAHAAGARYLAMEALWDRAAVAEANATRVLPVSPRGYLSQPEMRDLINSALELGWDLIAYEAEFARKPPQFVNLSREETNWREAEQGTNLAAALANLPPESKMLVWCGNSHLIKRPVDDWRPMGLCFAEAAGVEAFAIDQNGTVKFDGHAPPSAAQRWLEDFKRDVELAGGTAGFTAEEAPANWPQTGHVDGWLLSLDNEME
jgi:hypothetical protein